MWCKQCVAPRLTYLVIPLIGLQGKFVAVAWLSREHNTIYVYDKCTNSAVDCTTSRRLVTFKFRLPVPLGYNILQVCQPIMPYRVQLFEGLELVHKLLGLFTRITDVLLPWCRE